MDQEQALAAIDKAVKAYHNGTDGVEMRVSSILNRRLDELILAALGLHKDSWGDTKVADSGLVQTMLTDAVGVGITKWRKEVLPQLKPKVTKAVAAAIRREAKRRYTREFESAVMEGAIAAAKKDAEKLLEHLDFGSAQKLVEKFAAEQEKKKTSKPKNRFSKKSALLEHVEVIAMVCVKPDGHISSGPLDDPDKNDVRFLLSVRDKITRQEARIISGGDDWQPALVSDDGTSIVEEESYLLTEFIDPRNRVFTLMGLADKAMIAKAIAKFVETEDGKE